MRLFPFFSLCTLFLSSGLAAQTAQTLYTETFEGSSSSFTLNTNDLNSASSPIANRFILNNSYTGGTINITCLGFNIPTNVLNNSTQPSGITGQPSSHYVHTTTVAGASQGISNNHFQAADGFCVNAENIFARMNNDISTQGYDSVEVSFWWQGNGATGTVYGQCYYSTDGGNTWIALGNPLSGNSAWQQARLSLPALRGQNTLRLGFQFVNSVSSSPSDPGFGFDEIQIQGFVAQQAQVLSTSVPNLCAGQTAVVNYGITGNFNTGNNFTVELSDAFGSFANAQAIGSSSSTTAGSINVLFPSNLSAGSGYRLRIRSSNPATIGQASSLIFSALGIPNPGSLSSSQDSICNDGMTGITLSLSGQELGSSLRWQLSTNGGQSFQDLLDSTASINAAPNQTSTWRVIVSNTCASDTSNSQTVHVFQLATPSFTYTINGNTVNFTNTSQGFVASNWNFGNGFSSTLQDPSFTFSGPGSYPIQLRVFNALGCPSILLDTVRITAVGLAELDPTHQSRCYPNPAQDYLIWEAQLPQAQQQGQLRLYSNLGQLLWQQELGHLTAGTQQQRIELGALRPGQYHLCWLNEEGQILLHSFIKQ